MKIVVSMLLTVLVGMSVNPKAGWTQEQGTTSPPDIKSFVRQVYIEGVPYEEATRFDPASTTPILLGMLADSREEEHWPNIVITLGMLGDERAVDPLIRFLEQDEPATRLSRAHYVAKTGVPMALGYLINKTPSERALRYLQDSVRPTVWQQRNVTWASPYHADVGGRDFQLSKMAVLGLALTGRPAARETLRSLQKPPATDVDRKFQVEVRGVISEAMGAHETISREGLASYDRRRRR